MASNLPVVVDGCTDAVPPGTGKHHRRGDVERFAPGRPRLAAGVTGLPVAW
jgi:hypothetical protein